MLRDWAQEQKYHHDLKGFNYRLERKQGAVLRVKMAHIERWTDARRARAWRYPEALAPLGISTPTATPNCRHAYHVYAIRDQNRNQLQQFLTDRGIATGIHYPIPVHLQKAFAELGHGVGDFPHAESAAADVLSLPMFPEMTDSQQDCGIDALSDWTQR